MEQDILMKDLPMTARHWRILAVASMEQLIGAALSTVVGVAIPLLIMLDHGLTPLMQGVLGSAGLIGIAVGSVLVGKLSDRRGYSRLFRLCPALIALASLAIVVFPSLWVAVPMLFLAGVGVGGGYTLDGDYISELMPQKWALFMVGIAKALSSVGFCGAAAACWIMLKEGLTPQHWSYLFLILAILGALTLMMRLGFPDSPLWLMSKGRPQEAERAATKLFGKGVAVEAQGARQKAQGSTRPTIKQLLFSGFPWACEGVGVYGIGVFLPVLMASLGLAGDFSGHGMAGVEDSVGLTAIVNSFTILGFGVGLMVVRRWWHVAMISGGLAISGVALLALLAAQLFGWPAWISILAFLVFEVALNGGPHLVTFIIPQEIYSISDRGLGSGLSAMAGKVGAILGVFFLPLILDAWGPTGVLIACAIVMFLGAGVAQWLGAEVLPQRAS